MVFSYYFANSSAAFASIIILAYSGETCLDITN